MKKTKTRDDLRSGEYVVLNGVDLLCIVPKKIEQINELYFIDTYSVLCTAVCYHLNKIVKCAMVCAVYL